MKTDMCLRVFLVIAGTTLLTACSGPGADDHLARAEEYLEQGQQQEALIELRNAIQADPRRGDIRMKLADTYVETRNGTGALREYVRAADLLTDDVSAQVKAGSFLLLAGAFEDAKSRAERALALDPASADALILLANARAGLKDLDGALTEYQEAAALNPSDRVYAGMGTIQVARGELAEAEASFRKAVTLAPDSLGARLALANFLWSSRRFDEAEQELKAALLGDPSNVLVNRALGAFYLASGRAAEAETHFKVLAEELKTTEAALSLADYYFMTGRRGEAREVLQDLAGDAPAWAEATTRLAALDAAEGFRAQGIERSRAVLTRYPEDAQARLLLARLYLADGRREEAIAEATTVVQNQPSSRQAGQAQMLIGRVSGMLDRPEAAIKAYEAALGLIPQPFDAALALASLHLSRGATTQATTYVQQALVIRPDHPVARAMKVRILLAEGKTADARAEIASLEKQFPNTPEVLKLVGDEHAMAGRRAAARESFLKAAALLPGDPEPVFALLQLDMAEGRSADAVSRVESALKVNDKNGDLLVLAARVHASAGRVERAEELLKQAIALDPARLRGYGMLAELYMRENRLIEAEQQYQALVNKNPTSVSANTMLAMLFDIRGKFEDAERQYERVLALDPESAVAANNLAYRWAETNRNLDQALQLAQTANRRLPDDPNVVDTLGWAYYRKGLTAAAIRELERAVVLNGKEPTIRFHLALAYNQAGELDKAKQALTEALAISPSFPGAAEAKQLLATLSR